MIKSRPEPKYRSQFVLTAEGYWGDMDEKLHDVETFDANESDEAEQRYRA